MRALLLPRAFLFLEVEGALAECLSHRSRSEVTRPSPSPPHLRGSRPHVDFVFCLRGSRHLDSISATAAGFERETVDVEGITEDEKAMRGLEPATSKGSCSELSLFSPPLETNPPPQTNPRDSSRTERPRQKTSPAASPSSTTSSPPSRARPCARPSPPRARPSRASSPPSWASRPSPPS